MNYLSIFSVVILFGSFLSVAVVGFQDENEYDYQENSLSNVGNGMRTRDELFPMDNNLENQQLQQFSIWNSTKNFFSSISSWWKGKVNERDVKFYYHFVPDMAWKVTYGKHKIPKEFRLEPIDKEMPTETVVSISKDNIETSHLKPNIKYKFIFHGWTNNGESYFPLDIIGGYKFLMYLQTEEGMPADAGQLCEDKDKPNTFYTCRENENSTLAIGNSKFNLISVDWSAVGGNGGGVMSYINAYRYVTGIARHTANLIRSLMENNKIQSLDDVHLIGFSLGAQIAGKVGEILREEKTGLVGRITGLDPALWGFVNWSLNKSHAKFVDVIHTGGPVGKIGRCGHVDIYPSGGRMWNGWPEDCAWYNATCAHHMSHNLFALSIMNTKYPIAYKCETSVTSAPKIDKSSGPIKFGERIDTGIAHGEYCFCRNMEAKNLTKALNLAVTFEKIKNFGSKEVPDYTGLFAEWNLTEDEKCY